MDSFSILRTRLAEKARMPKSAWARLAVLLAALGIALYLSGAIAPKLKLAGWYSTTLGFVLWFLALVLLVLGIRWMRHNLMWRLRNRLVVTYIFIGVIPLLLLAIMGGIASYLFAGQFATFVVTTDITNELHRMETANSMLVANLADRARDPHFSGEQTVKTLESRLPAKFPGRTITIWTGSKSFVISKEGGSGEPVSIPDYLKKEPRFRSLVVDENNRIHLRVVDSAESGGIKFTVVTSVPMSAELLDRVQQGLGAVTVQPPDVGVSGPNNPEQSDVKIEQVPKDKSGVKFSFGQKQGSVVTFKGGSDQPARVSAGVVPPAKSRLDTELTFGTALNMKDWRTGDSRIGLLVVQTRLSTLYDRLFRTLGEFSNIILSFLIGVAILFAFIEVVALIIGVRLTRTMTNSVAQLYEATQHIETGELSHRIEVTREDQLAALERSFNSMTESLQKLIIEQKEKQRMESELAIAQEVQALLFPRDISSLEGFEVHGACKPARTVSGDYYDFLPVGPFQLGLAVGDISGKGISAALLMATVHAFVRAYTLVESVPALAAVGAGLSSTANSLIRMSTPGVGDLPPGTLLAMLNHQLYRSTPSEKYATMFLSFYDTRTRLLKYSNAGHLPPLVISSDGTVRALETGGLVVGLFGDVTYSDDSVEMRPGDIFVAYSDGITEPENEFGEFGEDRLIQLVKENHHLPLERISDIVVTSVTDWIGGAEQPDDVTLVLARAL